MGSLASVLSERRKELGLTLLQIAKQMDVSQATVQRWESGNIKSLRHEKITRLAEILCVSPAALMGWEDPESSIPDILPLPKTYKVPLVGAMAYAQPIPTMEDAEETVDVPENIHADFALRCKDDTMMNARIFDGDIVYIRKQEQVENGKIAAVLIAGSAEITEAALKRVYCSGDQLILQAENPAFAPIMLAGRAISQVRILGKAVAFMSQVR